MLSMHPIPLVLSILVSISVGLIAWGWLQARNYEADGAVMGEHNGLLIGFLLLAAFAVGLFVMYLLSIYV